MDWVETGPGKKQRPCHWGNSCDNDDCYFWHARDGQEQENWKKKNKKKKKQKQCRYGNGCENDDCYFRHPRDDQQNRADVVEEEMESKITMKIPGYVTCVKLSAENCDKMEKTFNEFDRNNDNRLTKSDFEGVRLSETWDKLFSGLLDLDGDGSIELIEFANAVSNLALDYPQSIATTESNLVQTEENTFAQQLILYEQQFNEWVANFLDWIGGCRGGDDAASQALAAGIRDEFIAKLGRVKTATVTASSLAPATYAAAPAYQAIGARGASTSTTSTVPAYHGDEELPF